MYEQLSSWLTRQGLNHALVGHLVLGLRIVAVIVVAWIAGRIFRTILQRVVYPLVQRSRTHWDDAVLQHGVLTRLAYLAPALIIYFLLPPLLVDHVRSQAFVVGLTRAYIALVLTMAGDSFLSAMNQITRSYELSRRAPMEVIAQALRIALWVIGLIFIISAIFDRSPLVFISGLGAMTAVTMLIFKDTILGLVAGFQISGNDLIRVGDWVSMPKYGADGNVLEVGLITVKVQNWDMTISSIPSQSFVNDTFRNWRGMTDSGGRRIKRAVYIDMTSIRFCDEDMLQRFRRMQSIHDYIDQKQAELAEWNRKNSVDESTVVNGRRLTNVGTFRAYLVAYLQRNPNISPDMTFIVRQLPPGPQGLPIEIYVFSKDQRWVQYEAIQSDIFDHVLAVIPEFDLRVFQEPTGADFRGLGLGARIPTSAHPAPTTQSDDPTTMSPPAPNQASSPENPNV
jgi:miniconductance mechanosensitive channel